MTNHLQNKISQHREVQQVIREERWEQLMPLFYLALWEVQLQILPRAGALADVVDVSEPRRHTGGHTSSRSGGQCSDMRMPTETAPIVRRNHKFGGSTHECLGVWFAELDCVLTLAGAAQSKSAQSESHLAAVVYTDTGVVVVMVGIVHEK